MLHPPPPPPSPLRLLSAALTAELLDCIQPNASLAMVTTGRFCWVATTAARLRAASSVLSLLMVLLNAATDDAQIKAPTRTTKAQPVEEEDDKEEVWVRNILGTQNAAGGLPPVSAVGA